MMPDYGNDTEIEGVLNRAAIKMIKLVPPYQIVLNRFCLKEDFITKLRSLNGSRNLVTAAFYLYDKPVVFLKGPEPKPIQDYNLIQSKIKG
jgi:hypothetical protein